MLILVINIGAISANEITDTNSLESDIEDSLSVTDYIDEETISSDQSLGAGDSSADSYDMASSNLGEADLSSSDSSIVAEEDEEQADCEDDDGRVAALRLFARHAAELEAVSFRQGGPGGFGGGKR